MPKSNPEDLEKAFCDRVERMLKDEGFQVQREVTVPGGRIDILAVRGDERWIVEAKRFTSYMDIRHALGQLLFYAFFHENVNLFFASPSKPIDVMLQLLDRYGIGYLPVMDAAQKAEQARIASVLKPFKDGIWRRSQQIGEWNCARCDMPSRSYPAIRFETDLHELVSLRWRLWWQCEFCRYSSEPDGEPIRVDDDEAARLIEYIGPWKQE